MISRCHVFRQQWSNFAALHNSLYFARDATPVGIFGEWPVFAELKRDWRGYGGNSNRLFIVRSLSRNAEAGANSMRRQIGKFLPVVMIAIWVQIFAPIGAYFAMAAAMDPFGSTPICAPSSTAQPGQSIPAGQQQSHPDCCQLCVVAQGGSAPLKSLEPGVATIVRSSQRIVWHDRRFDPAPYERDSNAQARAPPFLS
jgi:hypothetical protein